MKEIERLINRDDLDSVFLQDLFLLKETNLPQKNITRWGQHKVITSLANL